VSLSPARLGARRLGQRAKCSAALHLVGCWHIATGRLVAITVANRGRTDIRPSAENGEVDPERHLTNVDYRIAKGSRTQRDSLSTCHWPSKLEDLRLLSPKLAVWCQWPMSLRSMSLRSLSARSLSSRSLSARSLSLRSLCIRSRSVRPLSSSRCCPPEWPSI
jgi:hypothetical protein